MLDHTLKYFKEKGKFFDDSVLNIFDVQLCFPTGFFFQEVISIEERQICGATKERFKIEGYISNIINSTESLNEKLE